MQTAKKLKNKASTHLNSMHRLPTPASSFLWSHIDNHDMLILTPVVDLESPCHLTYMFLEKTHTSTGRTCKLHTERPQLGLKPAPSSCEAAVLASKGWNRPLYLQTSMRD